MMDTVVRAESWNRTQVFVLKAFAAAIFAFLTALAAHIRIPLPFTPIPMTLQTFVVPLAGGLLGGVWGGTSMLFYLGLGLAGLDVFAAAPEGTFFLLAPSAGYLIGFVPAAAIVGYTRENTRGNALLFLSLLLSSLLIFTFGVIGLMVNAHMSLQEAFHKGVAPFLPGDCLKLTAAFLVLLSYNYFTITVRSRSREKSRNSS